MTSFPILTIIIFLPILVALPTLFLPDSYISLLRTKVIGAGVVCFVLSIVALLQFNPYLSGNQMVESYDWIPHFGIRYLVGVDGLSILMLLLTTLLGLIVLIRINPAMDRARYFYASFLFLQSAISGVFCARDAILFYLFWEIMLVPMFLIIGVWGGQNRIYAALKFFIYTFLGSVLMLVAILWIGSDAASFSFADLMKVDISAEAQVWLFIAFVVALAIKVPMWPLHTWLPDAHVEAPTEGSMILAGLLLKVGGYGLIRLVLPLLPDASERFAPLMIALSLVAIIYIGLIALAQTDLKKLIAYASVAHMGFVTLGIFALPLVSDPEVKRMAMGGAVIQMVSHGLISAGMFLAVGMLYQAGHTRMIADISGLSSRLPRFAVLLIGLSFANAGLPGTSGFIGEFFVIVSVWQVNPIISALAALTLIIGAAYTLYMIRRVAYGDPSPAVEQIGNVSQRDITILAVLFAIVVVLGCWPAPIMVMF